MPTAVSTGTQCGTPPIPPPSASWGIHPVNCLRTTKLGLEVLFQRRHEGHRGPEQLRGVASASYPVRLAILFSQDGVGDPRRNAAVAGMDSHSMFSVTGPVASPTLKFRGRCCVGRRWLWGPAESCPRRHRLLAPPALSQVLFRGE